MKKRILSLLFALAVLVGMAPFSVLPALAEPSLQDGYYLVGTLNGESHWGAADLTPAMRLTQLTQDEHGEWAIDWHFCANDEIKVVKVENGQIAQWFKEAGDAYTIGESEAGDGTLHFCPEGNLDWHYFYFTVVPKTNSTATPTKTVYIGVVEYIKNTVKLHYWNNDGLQEGDAVLVPTEKTASFQVGAAYWENEPQTFLIYTAEIPAAATGAKAFVVDGGLPLWTNEDLALTDDKIILVWEWSGTYHNMLESTALLPTPTPTPTPTPAIREDCIYLDTGSNLWNQAGATFAVWTWGADQPGKALPMTHAWGNVYKVEKSQLSTELLFVRVAKDKSFDGSDWTNSTAWNMTADLTLPTGGKNMYVITAWRPSGGHWSTAPVPAEASALSQGSLAVIVGVAAAAIFGAGGFILGRKSKPKKQA